MNSGSSNLEDWFFGFARGTTSKGSRVRDKSSTHPITVASILWRLCALAAARQILRSWVSSNFPGVYGAMPGIGRGACVPIKCAVQRAHCGDGTVLGLPRVQPVGATAGVPEGCPISVLTAFFRRYLPPLLFKMFFRVPVPTIGGGLRPILHVTGQRSLPCKPFVIQPEKFSAWSTDQRQRQQWK